MLPALFATLLVQSNAPEDRFANERSFDRWSHDVHEVVRLGAREMWVILDTWRGDAKNTTPWVNADPNQGVDHSFLAERAIWTAFANERGVRVEISLFEEETFPLVTQAQRLELARAVAETFRGLDYLLCLSEELPRQFGGAPVEQLINAIHEVDPFARVTIHNPWWPSDEDAVLGPLAAACREGRVRLWGVSGQVLNPSDTTSFLQRWRAAFPADVVVRIVEIGPGTTPQPTVEMRGAYYTLALADADAGIYKGLESDVELPSILPWAQAYSEVLLSQTIARVPGTQWSPDLVLYDGSASVLMGQHGSPSEIRIWWSDGDGSVALPAGTWWLERIDPKDGTRTAPLERVQHAGGVRYIQRPAGAPRTDGFLVLREASRMAQLNAAALLNSNPAAGFDLNGDGVLDAADVIAATR